MRSLQFGQKSDRSESHRRTQWNSYKGTPREDGTRESERPKCLDLQSALEYVAVRMSDDKIVGKALWRVDMHAAISR